jgi:hypothetical protein
VQFVTSSYDFLPKTPIADEVNIFHANFRLYMAADHSFLRDLPHECFFTLSEGSSSVKLPANYSGPSCSDRPALLWII